MGTEVWGLYHEYVKHRRKCLVMPQYARHVPTKCNCDAFPGRKKICEAAAVQELQASLRGTGPHSTRVRRRAVSALLGTMGALSNLVTSTSLYLVLSSCYTSG